MAYANDYNRPSATPVYRCVTGKVAYATKGAANRGLNTMRASGHSGTRVYRCNDCRQWHVTSQSGRNYRHLPSTPQR